MAKIYVVYSETSYEFDNVVAAFTNRDRAKAYEDMRQKKAKVGESFYTQGVELDPEFEG